MLARSILTAADLGISESQHEGLLKTLHAFERGELSHVLSGESSTNGFNMARWDCGSTHCILGWAQIFSGSEFWLMPKQLMALCYPAIYGTYDAVKFGGSDEAVTPERAAHALSNYLTLGEPRWHEVMAN